jgi:hypothetical protein
VCRRGDCEPWVARRIAKLSRHLPLAVVGVVDSAVSRMIAREAPGRVLQVAAAKIIEADPDLHEERCEAERSRRYLGLGRTDEHGLRTLIARLEAGDAAAVDAVVHRVAEIITPAHPEAGPDELRAPSFGWLARPAELFALLLEHTQTDTEAETTAEPAQEPAQDFRRSVPGVRVPRRPPRRAARHRPDTAEAQGRAPRPPPRSSACE